MRLGNALAGGGGDVELIAAGDGEQPALARKDEPMTIILFLLAVSLMVAAIGLAAFLWSLRTGQYDDLDGAANRILFEED
jgi:cbb3-type cytochrome oxidase maturation protein